MLARNKSKVVLADGEVVHTAGKGSRPSKVIQTTIRNKNSKKQQGRLETWVHSDIGDRVTGCAVGMSCIVDLDH